VSAEGISGISKALESQHSRQLGLVTLDLSNNLLDDAAVKLLAAGLTVNGRLGSLNLAHNKIGNAGASIISEAAMHMPTLTSLNMSHNKIRGTSTTRPCTCQEHAPKTYHARSLQDQKYAD
jgi:Leucine-rich repeat (LRR) protein